MRIQKRPVKGATTVAADLTGILRAKSIAVVGATERNPFAASVLRNIDRYGFAGRVELVNPRGEPVMGRETLLDASDLSPETDAVFVCVPGAMVEDTVRTVAKTGAHGIIVVSSGFAETGQDGAKVQQSIATIAKDAGSVLIGPNALGFVNYVDGVSLCALERENRRGSLGIASVSGSVGGYIAKVAHLQGRGLSHMVLIGNEAGATIADVLDFLVDDRDTKSIAVFAEAIYEPDRFAAAAARALAARKPIVMLKAGAEAATANLAAAHTGALVGDDRVFDAVARELGIVRVSSYEDLVATATMLEEVGPLATPGVAMLTISGGSGEIASDLAGAAGVSMPPFSPEIRAEMDAIVSAFGQAHNPLDVTGAALADPTLWERLLTVIARDPAIGLPLCIWDVPSEQDPPWMAHTLDAITRGYAAFDKVPPIISTVREDISQHGLDALKKAGIPAAVCGLQPAMTALAGLTRWSARVKQHREPSLLAQSDARSDARPKGERDVLDWLSGRGVPVTPGIRAADAEAAVNAAESTGYPVALKIDAPDIAHKTEIGGVALGLADADAVRSAHDRMIAATPGARGTILSPMRRSQAELVVSVTRDPVWGPMLLIGLGGIWVEALDDNVLLPLPADAARIETALQSLRAFPLLSGARGRAAVDTAALSGTIEAIAQAALALDPDLDTLEINPLAVTTAGVEAMDALAIYTGGGRQSHL